MKNARASGVMGWHAPPRNYVIVTTLEIHTQVYREAPVVRVVEVVLSDVCQADVVAGIQIEHIVSHSTSDLESAVKAVEIVVLKWAERCPRAVVLDVAVGAHGQVAARIGLDARLVAHKVLVLDEQGQFQVVEVVGELVVARAALAALLGIIQTRLEEQGGAVGELGAGGQSDVQAGLGAAAVEQRTVAADVGGVHAHPQPEVVTVPGDILVAVASHRLHAGIVSISIARLCHGG